MFPIPTTAGYLVECYWPGVDEAMVLAAAQRTGAVAGRLRRQGHDVRFGGSLLLPGDEVVFHLFNGDRRAVIAASETAGLPFERVVPAIRVDGAPATEGTR